MLFLSVFNASSFAAGVPGDSNGDSRIDLKDAVYSLQVTSGLRASPLREEGFNALARKALEEAFSAARHFFIHENPSGTVTYSDLIEHGYNSIVFPDVTVTIDKGLKSNLLIQTRHNAGTEVYRVDFSGIINIHEVEKLAERAALDAFQAAQKFFAANPGQFVTINSLNEYGLMMPADVILAILEGRASTLSIQARHVLGRYTYTVDHNGAVTPQPEQAWMQRGVMPTPRESAGAAVVDGKIYVVGGWGGIAKNTLEKYNPATDGWTAGLASMPTARSSLAVVALNGLIYAIGGTALTEATGVLERYDPVSNTWTTLSPMPVPAGDVAGAVVNGKIYVIGGGSINTIYRVVREYEPNTDTWTTKADMSAPRSGLAVAAANGKIYAVGGFNGSTFLSSVEEYDPTSNAWTTKTAMPAPRSSASAVAVNGKIYVLGGWKAGMAGVPSDAVEQYDPALNAWKAKLSMPVAESEPATAVLNNRIYAVGGISGGGPPSGKNQEYDTTKDP
jgi:N-acetylneuraminic acid mutarotase